MSDTTAEVGFGERGRGQRRVSTLMLGRIALVAAAAVAISSAMIASAPMASASHKKKPAHHTTKKKAKTAAKTPCLVGNWTATNFALHDGGVTASGGVGTQVDISANQTVVGKFTPGTTLTSGSGTFKFSGTLIGKYGFNTKSTAKTGTFPVTYSSTATFMLSVNGGTPTPAGSTASTTGTYTCAGKGLTLSFPAGGDQVVYTLVPTK